MNFEMFVNQEKRRGHRKIVSRDSIRIVAFGLLCLVLSSVSDAQQDAAAFFKQNCTSCHTIGGGRLTGPDLKDVTTRKDRGWFVQFLQGPKSIIDSRDPYAVTEHRRHGPTAGAGTARLDHC